MARFRRVLVRINERDRQLLLFVAPSIAARKKVFSRKAVESRSNAQLTFRLLARGSDGQSVTAVLPVVIAVAATHVQRTVCRDAIVFNSCRGLGCVQASSLTCAAQ